MEREEETSDAKRRGRRVVEVKKRIFGKECCG